MPRLKPETLKDKLKRSAFYRWLPLALGCLLLASGGILLWWLLIYKPSAAKVSQDTAPKSTGAPQSTLSIAEQDTNKYKSNLASANASISKLEKNQSPDTQAKTDLAAAYADKGEALNSLNSCTESITAYKTAISLDPAQEFSDLTGIANCQIRLGDKAGATVTLNRLIVLSTAKNDEFSQQQVTNYKRIMGEL